MTARLLRVGVAVLLALVLGARGLPGRAAAAVYVELTSPQSDDQGHFVGFAAQQGISPAGLWGIAASPAKVTSVVVNGRPARLLIARFRPIGAPPGLPMRRFNVALPGKPPPEVRVTVTLRGGQTRESVFREDTDAAMARLRSLVAQSPGDAMVREALAEGLADTGKLDEAAAELARAIKADPTYMPAHTCLGHVRLKQSKPDEAVAEFRLAAKLEPTSSSPPMLLAFALAAQRKPGPAAEEALKAAKLAPDDPVTLCYAGTVIEGAKRPREALPLLRRAVELEPNSAEMRIILAEALVTERKLDDAAKECRRAVEMAPQLPSAHSTLAHILARQGKMDEALAESQKAVEVGPDDAVARMWLANALGAQDKVDESIAEARKAVALDPSLGTAHMTLAAGLYLKGSYLEAAKAQATARSLGEDLPQEFDSDLRGKAAWLRSWFMKPCFPMALVVVPLLGLLAGMAIGAAHASVMASYGHSLGWRQLFGAAAGLAVSSAAWLGLQWGFLVLHIGPSDFDFWTWVLYVVLVVAGLSLMALLVSLTGRGFLLAAQGLGGAPWCHRCRKARNLWQMYTDGWEVTCGDCQSASAPNPPKTWQ